MSTIEKFDSRVMHTYGRYPLVLEHGEGRSAFGEDGREYIDFGSGIGTNSLGYCDEDWADAVCAQARAVQHTSNYYYTKIQADFADKLAGVTGYGKMFFGNSGAEANECAVKIARKYSFDKYGKEAKRYNIITLKNSFHGRTLATLSATGQDVFHNYFFPFLEGFINAEANNTADLRNKIDDTVCAVMIEFVQGEGGVNPLDKAFVEDVFKLCAERDILVIADEVQTGAGRTGTFLTSEQYGVKPNITTLAKGVAGGVPIGVCLADEKCGDVLVKGTHGSTFGGNPLACAGGLAVVSKVGTAEFLGEVREKGEYFRKKLTAIPEVEGVDGLGLMLGVRLKTKAAGDVCAKCFENGLLTLTAKEKLRLLPPLNITYDEIDRGMEILGRVLE
ncbi:MAG: aspartate aminotransferase family protein [Ruminococcus sp.]|nr:aspartate aminotransferase family protein [Ruminococcus sp.]MCM1381127.1 aspartate aminotransferase family protein [Muribaculaceae bacterium]MCM1478090.1 aspartate aminotransferase family protein [Muribaculaceae bacterium]